MVTFFIFFSLSMYYYILAQNITDHFYKRILGTTNRHINNKKVLMQKRDEDPFSEPSFKEKDVGDPLLYQTGRLESGWTGRKLCVNIPTTECNDRNLSS